MSLSLSLLSSVCKILVILCSLQRRSGVKLSQEKDELLIYYVKENSPLNTIIGQITVPGFTAPFEIHEFQEKDIVIAKESGFIRVKGPIDRERRAAYSFVVVSVGGDTRNVRVVVQDENDNVPRFNLTSLEKTIPENTPVGSKVDLTAVYDPDEGANSLERVVVTSGDPEGQFGAEFYTGGGGYFYLRLILLRPLDHETASVHNIILEASDGGRPPLRASLPLRVIVANANDNAPKFDLSRYSAAVREDAPVGTLLLRVRASDRDDGPAGSLSFLLEEGGDAGLFAIDRVTGEVSLRASLDYERRQRLMATVIVRDGVPPHHISRASLAVDVIDVNDNAPIIVVRWPHSRREVDLDSQSESVVAHVSADDPDAVSTSFSLRIANEGPLKVEKISDRMWELRTTSLLTSVTTESLSVILELTDYPPPSLKSSKTLLIKVKRSKRDSFALSKGIYIVDLLNPISRSGENVTLISLSHDRPVEASEVFFSLTDGPNRLFHIGRHSGRISSSGPIDCGRYVFGVSLHSSRTLVAIDKAKVEVSIRGGRRSNLYFAAGFRRILLADPIGTADCVSQVRVSVANVHCNRRTAYRVEMLTKGSRPFRVTGAGDLCAEGAVQADVAVHRRSLMKVTASEPDFADASTNLLLIPATDPAHLRLLTNEVAVTVGPRNGTLPVARVVATVHNQPPPFYYGAIQYDLRAPTAEASRLLKVDQVTGDIFVHNSWTPKDSFTIIEVSSRFRGHAGGSSISTVTIHSEVEARFSKSMYEFYITLDYTSSSERVVGQVVLENIPWREGSVSYHLKGINTAGSVFSIASDTGVIRARNVPPQMFMASLNVYAEWKGSIRCYTQVLAMIDHIMAPPSFDFTSLNVNLWENATVGTEVVQMIPRSSSWTDVYSICHGRFSHWFSIDSRSGQLFLREKLDREETQRAIVTIKLTNRWGFVKSDVDINVLDNNDNEPVCMESIVNLTLGDNSQKGYVSCPFRCTDADTVDNGNLTYSLKMVFPNGIHSPLKMHSLTGCLEVVSTLDLWKVHRQGLYRYIVTVSDNGRDGAKVTSFHVNVKILDSNNHKPYVRSYATFHVHEGADPGTILGTVLLDDDDIDDSIKINVDDPRYREYLYTEIIKKNEAILRSHSLKGLRLGVHHVRVSLEDNGLPLQRSFVNLTFIVEDSNDHDPVVTFPQENQTVSFDCPLMPGASLLKLQSRDLDIGMNSRSTFVIEGEDIEDVFALDRWTGVLAARKQPHCSQSHRLKILVHDMGHPRRSSSRTFHLSTTDRGTVIVPTFNQNMSFVVPEKARAGQILGILQMSPWMKSLGMTFLFGGTSTTSPDERVHIDYEDQRLMLLKDKVSEGSSVYSVSIFCHKAIVPPRSFDFYLHLHWNTLPNVWPSFLDEEATVRVTENRPPGTMVKRFATRASENNAVVYSLRQPGQYFVVDPVSGVMVTFVSMDREKMPHDEFFVEVIATDFADPSKTAVLPVRVVVEDENDNSPVILSPVNTSIEVALLDSRNNSVTRVVAVDLDKDKNAQLRYAVEGSDLFSIDSLSGAMWLVGTTRLKTHEVNVTVSDRGWPSLTSWVVLTFHLIKSGIDDRIRFATNVISVNVSIGPGQRAGVIGRATVAASPTYPNPDVRFHLMAGKFSHLLAVDAVTGDIRTLKNLLISDIGSLQVLKLSLVAYNVKDPSTYDSAKLLIHIDHGNNHAPSFAKSNFVVNLPEGEAITDFLTVAAHDPDLGVYGMVTYQLLGDTGDRRISIDPTSGRLSCSSLNYLEKSEYRLEVVASDSLGGVLSKNQSSFVQVLVQNSKQPSMQFNSTHFIVFLRENLPSGTSLGTITIRSGHPRPDIVYLLNPGHPLISINSSNGQLKTNGPVDRERIQAIEVTIQAISTRTDPEKLRSSKAIVTVKVTDENDKAPLPSHNPVLVHIPNPKDPASPLTKLTATDLDSSSNITYRLDKDHPATRSLSLTYALDPISGALTVRSKTLKVDSAQHILQVVVSDNGTPPRITHVVVHISIGPRKTLLNIGPQEATFRIQENPSAGTFIGQLSIQSNCSSSRASFTVIDGVSKELVYMHSTSGKIFVSSSGILDRERVEEVVLWAQVRCLDTDLWGYKKVVIRVDDLDDNRPRFSQSNYDAFVLEGQPARTLVVRTSMYDPDEGINSQVEYFIELSSPLDEFSIDSEGTIKTNLPLNFHTKSTYSLIVKATSRSTPLLFAECRVTVYIVNINDQRPIFASPSQDLQIREDQPVGTLLTTVTATDSDGPSGISYRIRPQAKFNSFLSVAYDSGEVYLSRRIESADIGRHDMDVVADDGRYSSSTILKVEITDVNNEFPDLVEDGRDFIIPETAALGSVIVTLHAFDGDKKENGEVTFEINPPLPWLGLQDLGNNTAVLTLLSAPSQKNKVRFLGIALTDRAKDPKGRLSSMSTISLLTESSNPHPPSFANGSEATVKIPWSQSIASRLTSLQCSDPDDKVKYRVNASAPLTSLHIDPFTGDVFLTERLDKYEGSKVEVTVVCRDNGKPRRQTSILLRAIVDRKPRILPVVTAETIKVQVAPTSRFPFFIGNLQTIEKPFWAYNHFTLISASPSSNLPTVPNASVFHGDSSGNIWLVRPVQSGCWNLVLRVVNQEVFSNNNQVLFHCSYMKVRVAIEEPRYEDDGRCSNIDKLTAVIKENVMPPTTVLHLPMGHGDLRYSLEEDEFFSLSCNYQVAPGCRVDSKVMLDFERNERYNLNLMISGGRLGRRGCSHSLVLQVHVLDVDEYPPVFSKLEYRYSVPGGVPKQGSVLLKVTATDSDKGVFGFVYYRLEASHDGHFGIRNETGEIYLKAAFDAGRDQRVRRRRSLGEGQPKKQSHRKTFTLQVVASSGEKRTVANVRLSMLVPYMPEDVGAKADTISLTTFQMALIIGVPSAIIVLTIIVILVLILWKYKCLCVVQKPSEPPSNYSDGSRSLPTDSLKKYISRQGYQGDPPLPPRPSISYHNNFQRGLPDVAVFPSRQMNSLQHSDTQEFSFNSEDNFQHPDNRNTSTLSHSSGASSMRVEGSMPMSYGSESLRNGPPSSLFCDSGLGHNNRTCVCYNENNNQKPQYRSNGHDPKYHESDRSGTSSSCYSAISQKQLQSPYPLGSQINRNDRSQRSIDHTTISPKRFMPSKEMFSRSSVVLKNDQRDLEAIPLQNVAQLTQRSYIDVRNNNHPSAMPLLTRFDDRHYGHNMQFVSFPGCGSERRMCQVVSVDVPSFSAISQLPETPSHHDTYAQTYADTTDIDC